MREPAKWDAAEVRRSVARSVAIFAASMLTLVSVELWMVWGIR